MLRLEGLEALDELVQGVHKGGAVEIGAGDGRSGGSVGDDGGLSGHHANLKTRSGRKEEVEGRGEVSEDLRNAGREDEEQED